MQTIELSRSRTYPVSPERAFDVTLNTPLNKIFGRRFGLISAIRETEEPDGWGVVGKTRTVRLADGVRMREELTSLNRPRSFGYRLDDIMQPLGLLISTVDGTFSFEPSGTGAKVTWTWTVHPASKVAALSEPVFRWFWDGYARQGLEDLEPLLLNS